MNLDKKDIECIKSNLQSIELKIENVCKNNAINRENITLLSVTKTRTIEEIMVSIDEGYNLIGENKVQEIREKYPILKEKAKFHLIGHLQTNKVKYIVDKVELIHSVDSLKLAKKIDEEAAKKGLIVSILIQVNIANDENKYGFRGEDVEEAISIVSNLKNVRIKGLMTIVPFVENPEENRVYFRKMKQLFVDIAEKNIDNINMEVLSMGMTNDYLVALEEGANCIRIGTGIFGKRNYTTKR